MKGRLRTRKAAKERWFLKRMLARVEENPNVWARYQKRIMEGPKQRAPRLVKPR